MQLVIQVTGHPWVVDTGRQRILVDTALARNSAHPLAAFLRSRRTSLLMGYHFFPFSHATGHVVRHNSVYQGSRPAGLWLAGECDFYLAKVISFSKQERSFKIAVLWTIYQHV